MKSLLRGLCPAHAAAAAPPLRSIARTHVGRVREVNEDRTLDRADLCLWAVADGMGGHSHGDAAAETVVAHLSELAAPVSPKAFDQALRDATRKICETSKGKSGTTLVTLTLDNSIATIRWAGDSRAYLIRDEQLTLLTRDHSVVQELVDAGLLDPSQCARHPQANVITRALGIEPEPALETVSMALQPGDRVLLCSDGLSRTLAPRDVRGQCMLQEMADRLITNALHRDGSDNISLVLVEVDLNT